MKKILFFSESLNGGGAELALLRLVELLSKSYDITVISETDGEKHTEKIKKLCKYKSFTKKSNLPIINNLIIKGFLSLPAKAVSRLYLNGSFDIEVACCEGYSTKIIGNSTKNSIKIAYIHTDFINNPWSVSVYNGGEDEERECYSKFDKIICVSETIKNSFIQKYGLQEKVEVIYNLIDDKKITQMAKENAELKLNKKPAFVLVGNYLQVKGYDRLMNVAKRLRDNNYEFSITIMGRDEEKSKIQAICNKYNLNNYVNLMDFQENPYKFMKKADCYICSSYAEGYSTAVCEAIITGLPVITTECSGMREIFGKGDIGIICENTENGLYEAIKKVLDNPDLLKKYKENALQHSKNFTYESRAKVIQEFYDSL